MAKNYKKAKFRNPRSVKGALVKGYLEKVDRKAFEYLLKDFRRILGKSSGIYGLYNGDNLYYVGIADKLLDRVDYHTHDKHMKNWDSVSFFVIDRHKYSKDIETLILRLLPKASLGNGTRGKFEGHYKMRDELLGTRRQLKDIAKRL